MWVAWWHLLQSAVVTGARAVFVFRLLLHSGPDLLESKCLIGKVKVEAGEKAHQLEHLTLFQKTQVQFSAPTWLLRTTFSATKGDLMPSLASVGPCTCACTNIHSGTCTCAHKTIKYKVKVVNRGEK